ncbi:MAG: hypothetical protein M3Q64_00255, partial [bacterium]|nr:hypothetical protein [bacterium]
DKKYTYGRGYLITVPEGSYTVYATLGQNPRDPNAYRAFYSEYVKCGVKASCTNHTPIIVQVNHSQTTSGIDPQDWYNTGDKRSQKGAHLIMARTMTK